MDKKNLRYSYKAIKTLRKEGLDPYKLADTLGEIGEDTDKLEATYIKLYWGGRLHETPGLSLEQAAAEMEEFEPGEFYGHVNAAYRRAFEVSGGDK